MLTLKQVLQVNAGINPQPAYPGEIDAPIAPDVGVLRNLGAQTRLIHGKNEAGAVILKPGAADAGTVTLRNQSPEAFSAYTLQEGGYVTLQGGDYLRIGVTNINIAESHFLAVLYRIDKSSYIEGYSGATNIIRTTQQTSSRYNRQLLVAGSLGSVPSSSANRLVSYMCEGFSADPEVAGSQRISDTYSSTYNLPNLGATVIYPGTFGADAGANESPDHDWVWAFVRGSAAGETETGVVSLMCNAVTHAAQNLVIGHMWHPKHGIAIPNTCLCSTVLDNGVGNITTDSASALKRATPTFAAQDFVIGDAVNTIDIACVIHLSRFTRLLDAVLMMQGMHPADMGLSPLASDFVAHFGSAAQAAASSGFAIAPTGTPIYSAAGGPMLLRKLGSVAAGGSRTDVVTGGAVA